MGSVWVWSLLLLVSLIGDKLHTVHSQQLVQGINAHDVRNVNNGGFVPLLQGAGSSNDRQAVGGNQLNIQGDKKDNILKPRSKKKKKRRKRSETNNILNKAVPVGQLEVVNPKRIVQTPQPLPLEGVNNLNNLVHKEKDALGIKENRVQENVIRPVDTFGKDIHSDNRQFQQVVQNHMDANKIHDNVQHKDFAAPNEIPEGAVKQPAIDIVANNGNLNDAEASKINNSVNNLQFAQINDNVASMRRDESNVIKNNDFRNPQDSGVVTEHPRGDMPNKIIVPNNQDQDVNPPSFQNNNFQNNPPQNMDNNNLNNNNNFGQQQWGPVGNQMPQRNSPNKKQDSLRIMWDWSDFLINYEQYVMPEQKVRRAPHSSTGEPWPMPQYYISSKTKLFKIDKEKFHFRISKESCDIIEKATERYRDVILYDAVQDMYDNLQHAQGSSLDDVYEKYGDEVHSQAQYIEELNIKIRQPCTKFPSEKMDESYDLFVKRTGAFLWANEVWGALQGLETFSQLVFKGTNDELYIRDTVINDYPRFAHRGILLDSSRHYIFKEVIFDVLEGMSQNKMNVLHWHIVDDQSFPYQSKVYPDLSDKGAYHPTFVYTHEDIDEIIEYARLRGIRVMPEIDTPGHTYSWGLSRPDLLTQCYQGSHPVNGYLGPLDPSKNETYRFLKNLFNEVLHVYKDDYIHLGGDEVPMTCWSSNPEVLALLNRLEGKPDQPINLQNVDPYMYSYDIRKVLEYYEKRLTQSLKEIGKRRKNGVRFVMWQEIMNNNIQLPNDTIIQIWQGDMSDVQRAIDMGYQTLYSTCWYLDLIEYGVKWPKYYNCDPADTSMGYQIDEKKVLGGEACLWAEYIDNENLMTTLWPRASATAERLWSSKDVKDVEAAGIRLQEHRCRMLSRGLSVGQISGPDYCFRRGHRRERDNQGNCSSGHCTGSKDTVQIERFNVRVQRANPLPDCNKIISHGGSAVSVILIIILFFAILISIKVGGTRMVQVRFCKNKNIFVAFVMVILVYFMCSTSLWMQVLEFKGSFEKRIKSSYSDKG